MRKQYVRRKNTMKKFLATVLTIVLSLGFSCPAYAAVTPGDLKARTRKKDGRGLYPEREK